MKYVSSYIFNISYDIMCVSDTFISDLHLPYIMVISCVSDHISAVSMRSPVKGPPGGCQGVYPCGNAYQLRIKRISRSCIMRPGITVLCLYQNVLSIYHMVYQNWYHSGYHTYHNVSVTAYQRLYLEALTIQRGPPDTQRMYRRMRCQVSLRI